MQLAGAAGGDRAGGPRIQKQSPRRSQNYQILVQVKLGECLGRGDAVNEGQDS